MSLDSLPDRSSIRAAVTLLGDEDPKVRRACARQLLAWGELAREALEIAEREPEPRVRAGARRVLLALDVRRDTERLAARLVGAEDLALLEEGVLGVAAIGRSRLVEADFVRARLADLAADLRPAADERSAAAVARHLAAVFTGRHGLAGSDAFYEDRDNVRIDRVLARGRGLSAVLAAVWVIAGRRAGLALTPVRLPEWFVVRLDTGGRRVLLDPFHGGRTVTRADCLRYVRNATVRGPASAWLADVDERVLLAGILHGFARVHHRADEQPFRDAARRLSRVLRAAWRST